MSFELKPVRPPRPAKIDLSVVLPIYDEEESLNELVDNLFRVLDGLNRTYEIWCVNDGSHDRSSEILHEIAKRRPEIIRGVKRHGEPHIGSSPAVSKR